MAVFGFILDIIAIIYFIYLVSLIFGFFFGSKENKGQV
tara:strand:- start:2229 stop:2342 length:114 start_codon:yes stop_codon:yes gene_type:complete